MSVVDDHYPSTLDLPPMRGGEDMILGLLMGAKKRYQKSGYRGGYIGSLGSVCALGALGAELGLSEMHGGEYRGLKGWVKMVKENVEAYGSVNSMESDLIKASKEALKRLNQAVKELYPDVAKEDLRSKAWNGPLEHLNQTLAEDKYKQAVLKCYKKAIDTRKEEIGAVSS